MDKNKVAITLGIVCLILTIAICMQINTIKNANSTVSQTLAENGLRDEVLKWKEKYDNISSELDNAEKKLGDIREKSTENDSDSSEKEEQIRLNNNLLGITNLVGQGIEMTIQDDPNATRENIGIYDDISAHIVHDADLRAIVNELKNAGAEAISINNERVVPTTSIICGGNVININEEKIGSPFVIKAIGLPETLANLNRTDGTLDRLKERKIKVELQKNNEITIPKYTGVFNFKYAKSID